MTILVASLLITGSIRAAILLPPADLASATRWATVDGTPTAVSAQADGRVIAQLRCPFSTLAGWRAAWDVPFEQDLSGHRWLKLRVRATDPDAVAGVNLYFEAGSGWYVAGLGGLAKDWTTLTATRSKFHTEGTPGPWSTVTRLRIGVLPAAKRDTVVEVAGLEGTSAFGVQDAVEVGPYHTANELKAALADLPASRDAYARGAALLDQAARAYDPEGPEAQARLKEARAAFVDAYVRAQRPKAGEIRGVWCHSGYGPGMGWAKAVDALADAGFNAIFPNLLWSGVAFYPSRVLPVDKDVARRGDQAQAVLDAAHRRGMKVHVWKVSWQFGWMSDPAVAVPFRFAGRCQVDADGRPGDWLCPSNPVNRKYELDAIRELVTNYAIDGFHLDYIRFSGDTFCFCPVCRANFEQEVGKKLGGWPGPVVAGGAYEARYRDWRRGLITSFVREVHREVKRLRPGCQVSAAVFPVPDSARESVLQDWGAWCREGLLDFVCPMNYTENLGEMSSRLKAEVAAAGRVPVVAGLYASYGPDQSQSPDAAVSQIAASRELGAAGFTLFELNDAVVSGLLPALRLGLTAP